MTVKIKYDFNLIKFISMFESLTKASVKDCFMQGDKLVFIVKENQIGKALGKGGSNIKRLENSFKKKIKIAEFNPDLLQFIKNLVYPLQIKDIKEEEDVVTITPPDSKTRGYLIGRAAVNLRNTEDIVKRYFEIKEIKVI
jgi:N utilization substance protein A